MSCILNYFRCLYLLHVKTGALFFECFSVFPTGQIEWLERPLNRGREPQKWESVPPFGSSKGAEKCKMDGENIKRESRGEQEQTEICIAGWGGFGSDSEREQTFQMEMRALHTNQGQVQTVHRHHGNPLWNREAGYRDLWNTSTKNLTWPVLSFKKRSHFSYSKAWGGVGVTELPRRIIKEIE